MAKNAKQILHEFFQQRPQFGKPVYSHQQQISPEGELRFAVSLDISGVRTQSGTGPPVMFLGTAKQKKLGEHAAAEEAVRWLVDVGLLRSNVLSSMTPVAPPSAASSSAVASGYASQQVGQNLFRSPVFAGPGFVFPTASRQSFVHQHSSQPGSLSLPLKLPVDVPPLPPLPKGELLSEKFSLEDIQYMQEDDVKETLRQALLQNRDYKRYQEELLKRLKDVERFVEELGQLAAAAAQLLSSAQVGGQA